MTVKIKVENLIKLFDQTLAINNLSFTVQAGEIFVIMGLSGSGKSTILRCLNRLIEASSGSILVDGQDITKYNNRELQLLRQQKMTMVFQQFGLLPHRTVLQNAAYGLEVRGLDKDAREEKARKYLTLVGLSGWEDYYPEELSGGMKQRVGLARALANDPEILLMDEAFSALDPLIRHELQGELMKLQQQMHKTIIFVTHDFSEAVRLADRIAFIREGCLVQVGSPGEIMEEPADEYVAKFVSSLAAARGE